MSRRSRAGRNKRALRPREGGASSGDGKLRSSVISSCARNADALPYCARNTDALPLFRPQLGRPCLLPAPQPRNPFVLLIGQRLLCAAQVPRRCRDTAPPAPTCAQPPLPRCPSMVAGPPAFINSVCVPRAPPLRACVGMPPPFFPPGASSVIAPLKSVRSVCGMPALNHRYRGAREICPSLFIAMLRSSRILQLDA